MAAWLCRRWTGATLRELGPAFVLTGTDSVSNLVRRAHQQSRRSASWRKMASKIETSLHLNTEHKACPRKSPLRFLKLLFDLQQAIVVALE